MNTAVATIEHRQPVRSVLIDMATRFGMEPAAFEATVRATCMKPDKNGRVPSREEFAAFLLVAKEYNLNPLTKEIYAFAAKGGGIVPIVSIDGWVNLVNSHGACDGFEFEMEHDAKGILVSCTCRMYRKDRSRPVVVTEYLSECIRNTEPWAMKHRMLRHKAMVQAARYAFGFSGVYDEDEGAKIAEARDVTREEPPRPPSPALPAEELIHVTEPAETVEWTDAAEQEAAATDQPPVPPSSSAKKADPISSGFPGDKPMKSAEMPDIPENLRRAPPKKDEEPVDVEEWLSGLAGALSGCEDTEQLAEVQNKHQEPMKGKVSKADWAKAHTMVMEAFARISEGDE
ncbi:MAG: RecT family recombinase [Hyphomicrobium sp.]|jgi:phage recombination protein Bet